MAFKTFTVGEIFTASDANAMFMKQVLIVCTSGTRPSSPAEGWHIYETDTDKVYFYTGAAWTEVLKLGAAQTFTPTWTTSGTAPSLGNGTLLGKYIRVGKLIQAYIQFIAGTTTTFGTGSFQFLLPFSRAVSATRHGGGGFILDDSAVAYSPVTPRCTGDNVNVVTASGLASASTPFTWANLDEVNMFVSYETDAT